ncbi:ANR family transcriptional regulator [Lonsdalea britannica]|uniref:ANR family transcriptional regulator n=1 Tax=Lonsdalea britannica TaxID=1082704 RepID=UPI0026EC6807|nr:ANR family transcriptional regulator [Lonsdalea britannica]
MATKNSDKADLLRAVLQNGPRTSAELTSLTGIRAKRISECLARDIRRGTVVRGTINHRRVFGLAGSIDPIHLKVERHCQGRSVPIPTKSDFTSISQFAAELERRQQFIQARRVWLSASTMAHTHEKRNWCEIRAHVCSNSMREV